MRSSSSLACRLHGGLAARERSLSPGGAPAGAQTLRHHFHSGLAVYGHGLSPVAKFCAAASRLARPANAYDSVPAGAQHLRHGSRDCLAAPVIFAPRLS